METGGWGNITARMSCAVESAAKLHPTWTVALLYLKGNGSVEGNNQFVSLLRGTHNIDVTGVRVSYLEYVTLTPALYDFSGIVPSVIRNSGRRTLPSKFPGTMTVIKLACRREVSDHASAHIRHLITRQNCCSPTFSRLDVNFQTNTVKQHLLSLPRLDGTTTLPKVFRFLLEDHLYSLTIGGYQRPV